ncbi:unnamed protein product [Parascedosporium putredinis]|uniref:Uncharacterized protein n=1 Tax=Parascedosporium putredinis TaxID=1442378 RepID=A0A9P1HB27_9PEZI|nr:unnamed protein product [Parascedosporium putredinis]CAI8003290.1 unnamed protein product [Parascedosporium putredinis]
MLSLQGSFPNNYDHRPTSSYDPQARSNRKRKADPQDNERLSKRLGRLNIGPNLKRLYATVEDDTSANQAAHSLPPYNQPLGAGHGHGLDDQGSRCTGEHMQMDDSKHKVYIYNIDDELSSSESEAEEGRLIFLPDIEKALRANRIPRFLYNVPASLTIAPEHDNVRKAIVEARQRARERQRRNSSGYTDSTPSTPAASSNYGNTDDDVMDLS